jgi:hypothetical protein
MSGSLVRSAALTSTSLSTLSPATSASSTAGLMPTPATTASAGTVSPSDKVTLETRAPSPWISDTPAPIRRSTPCAVCSSANTRAISSSRTRSRGSAVDLNQGDRGAAESPAGSGRAFASLQALARFATRPLVLDLADQISTHLREGMIEVALVGGGHEVRPSR